ncbi:MAG: cytochrome P450 [Candidatus Tectomicrobia bacterium]|nr:cytochrome P450 [Candidatus Tectomicrobia bacterium]
MDLFDPGFQPDAPEVHAAREARWYARTPQGYAVLRYAEVTALLRDRRTRNSTAGPPTWASSSATPWPRPRIEAALLGLAACVDDLLAARRAAPGPDLISALIAAEEAGDQLSDTELRVLVTGLVFAGQDTTRNQLGCALATFLAHPAQWARLADAPALAARAVEEVMRVRRAVPVISRVATEAFEFEGLRIAAGTLLSLVVASANTDPRGFGTDGFDITRERPAQLTFGGGLHHCLGAPLARAEMAEALPIRFRTAA